MVFSRTRAFLPEPWNRLERMQQKKPGLSPEQEEGGEGGPDAFVWPFPFYLSGMVAPSEEKSSPA